jgi:hypothetical protein
MNTRRIQKRKAAIRTEIIAAKKRDNKRSKGGRGKVRLGKRGEVFTEDDLGDDVMEQVGDTLLDHQAEWAREEEEKKVNVIDDFVDMPRSALIMPIG